MGIVEQILDMLAIYFRGKHIAVVGARGVGKTHFIEFLTTGSIPDTYHQTVSPRKSPSRRFQLRDLDIKIKPIVDIGGSVEARGNWKREVHDADIVFHLFRADEFISGNRDAISRVLSDAQHIHDWIKNKKRSCDLFLIGTYCDVDPEFRGTDYSQHGNYVDRFRELQNARDLVLIHGGEAKTNLIIGSMKTPENTQSLVEDIFKTINALR